MTTGAPSLGQGAPDRVEQRVAWVVRADLHMGLEHPCAAVDPPATYPPAPSSGKNVAVCRQSGVRAAKSVAQLLSQPPCRLVRIDHRREGAYAEGPEHGQPFVLGRTGSGSARRPVSGPAASKYAQTFSITVAA